MGGINLYGFVGNDGVNAWDLLGLAMSKNECDELFEDLMRRARILDSIRNRVGEISGDSSNWSFMDIVTAIGYGSTVGSAAESLSEMKGIGTNYYDTGATRRTPNGRLLNQIGRALGVMAVGMDVVSAGYYAYEGNYWESGRRVVSGAGGVLALTVLGGPAGLTLGLGVELIYGYIVEREENRYREHNENARQQTYETDLDTLNRHEEPFLEDAR